MQDEPFDTLGIYAQYRVYDEMKKAQIKVSLDGQGADEIFAGYGTYRGVIMRENFFKINLVHYKNRKINDYFNDFTVCILVGLARFELAHARVKVWCLTAWLHPNIKLHGVEDGTRTHGLQCHKLAR